MVEIIENWLSFQPFLFLRLMTMSDFLMGKKLNEFVFLSFDPLSICICDAIAMETSNELICLLLQMEFSRRLGSLF